jgi:hypothetical protein
LFVRNSFSRPATNPGGVYLTDRPRLAPGYVGNRTGIKLLISELLVPKVLGMFINSIPVDVVGDAHHIAADYLKKTGRIPSELDIHQPLLDSIVEDFRAGKRNN